MAVRVLVPGVLRGECGDQSRLDVAVDGEVTLGEVLDRVAERHPRFDRRIRDEQGRLRRFVNVFVGESECRTLSDLGTVVPDGTEVSIIPSVAGG